ncbi:hypothetical protein C8J56DRAFT_924107 [Mycena floridula]|nr:hypothetical protein C8J56DRAFT_924107 [Mycena floridula]
MLKFQDYTRTVLRANWAQHARSFSSAIPQSCLSFAVRRQIGKAFLDPTTVRNHFQGFEGISRIRSGLFGGATITFVSPEQAKKLQDTVTEGEVRTESGEIYCIKALNSTSTEPPSTYLNVKVFQRNVEDAAIRDAFSVYGLIVSLTKEQECHAMGHLPYSAQFIVQFTNIEDAIKANSNLVSLPNGGLLQTKMVSKESLNPGTVLQFVVERPWSKIQPGYSCELFVKDLSRISDIPLEDLDYRYNNRYCRGLMEVLLKTKTITAAQKIKAVQSAQIHNATFSVKHYHADFLSVAADDLPAPKENLPNETKEKKETDQTRMSRRQLRRQRLRQRQLRHKRKMQEKARFIRAVVGLHWLAKQPPP